jgi:hypothetical protein
MKKLTVYDLDGTIAESELPLDADNAGGVPLRPA